MPDHQHFRNVVLGAGAMGCAAVYQLAKRGEPVALIDQFAAGHTRGSSHSAGRIIRHSYADPRYARLMPEAFRAWRELEAEAGVPLYLRTGGVSFSPPGVDYVAQVAASLAEIDVPHRRMTGEEWSRRNIAFGIPPKYDVVFEPDAGMIAASRAVGVMLALADCLAAAQRAAPREGTVLLPDTPIRRIDLEGEHPALVGDGLVITAERLIVAAGAWVGKLLPELAGTLVPTHQQVLYFHPLDEAAFAPGRFPVFIHMGAGQWNAFYGMPSFLGTGVKVARHGGPPIDPDSDDRAVDEAYRDTVRAFLKEHIPVLGRSPIEREEVCLYTMAPGEEFVVGPHPARPDVLVASPCSGHGFKFAPVVGRVLADLITTGTTPLDVTAWRTPDPVPPPLPPS
jgi:sarcosine oxidase